MRRSSDDAMRLVRGEFSARLDRLEQAVSRRGSLGLDAEAASLGELAAEYGLGPAQRLAEGLRVALSTGGRGAAVQPWIERLRDAVDCQAADPRASDTWLASIMVRFAG